MAFSPLSSGVELDAGLDGNALAHDGAMEHAEQRRAMHGEAETAAGARVVADIEHGAAALRIGPVEAVDAAAELPDLVEEAERGEHGQAGRLQDQTGADGRRLVETLEDGDAVPCLVEEQRRGEPGRTGSDDGDVEMLQAAPGQLAASKRARAARTFS